MEPSHSRPLAGLASKNQDVVSNGLLPVQDCRTRVLVVDNSSFMQRRLTEILQSVTDLRVVGYADGGAEAIRLTEELTPDAITIDVNMSGMDGLHAIDCIMRSNPRPIVIVSSYNQKGSRAAFQGLDIGVVDIIEKPVLNGPASESLHCTSEIIGKVRMAAGIRLPPRLNCSPGKTSSVDVLFHSLARRYGAQVLAFVLTGMGEDGAVGASAIKRAGGIVIAQDEGSSMVFSMPGAAIKAGGVSHVLSKDKMKQLLLEVGEKTIPKSRSTSHDNLSYN